MVFPARPDLSEGQDLAHQYWSRYDGGVSPEGSSLFEQVREPSVGLALPGFEKGRWKRATQAGWGPEGPGVDGVV